MRAPISVIVPTLNAGNHLSECLAALVEGLDAGLIRELIITDGGSTDDTHALAEAWGAVIVSGEASRGGQLRRGCGQAQGTWLLVLHADTQLAPGWSKAAAAHIASGTTAGWFDLRFDRGGRFVAGWANLRSRLGLPYGDQGLLLPRTLYDKTGGFPDIPLMEDVAMARALRGQLRRLGHTAVTSSDKYRAQGWIKRGARNLTTLGLYALGVSPERLAARYQRD